VKASFQRGAVARYVVIGIAVIAVVVVIGVLWIVLGPGPMDFAGGKKVALAGYNGPNPTGVPPVLAQASLTERGEYLSRAADCQSCHTARDGLPFAGGRAFVLPFGTLYSTNITPDGQTGIGGYSDADFLRAVHRGIRRDGVHLYPAMPYDAYTYMTDADALAIKAYLFSLAPVHASVRQNTLVFPFNQRWLLSIWSLLFSPDRRFEPNTAHDSQWNRGAYLVEALGHCGECHTPRNLFEALNNRRKFAGAVQSGWRAYNVTTDSGSGIGDWTDEELTRYIWGGHADGRGTASGPMGEAVDLSLAHLAPDDVAAIVTYEKTIPAMATPDLPPLKATPAPASHRQGVSAAFEPYGKQIFEGACVSCHDWTGVSPLTSWATLTGARAVNDPTATNVAQIVLSGTVRETPHGQVFMPAFGDAYSDVEIAAVANYVTARFGAKPSAISAKNVAKLRKQGAE
jgi:mono/diheme cytochrome c family protein